LVALTVRGFTEDKFHLAYAIYGSFAVVGIALPLILIWRKSDLVVFPGLFFSSRLPDARRSQRRCPPPVGPLPPAVHCR